MAEKEGSCWSKIMWVILPLVSLLILFLIFCFVNTEDFIRMNLLPPVFTGKKVIWTNAFFMTEKSISLKFGI